MISAIYETKKRAERRGFRNEKRRSEREKRVRGRNGTGSECETRLPMYR
jgi:hypothetical protein